MSIIATERSYDAERKADSRAKSRDLVIPEVLDKARREACEADDCLWLQTYCSDVFYNPFTPHQKTIIADCGEALQFGTKKCKAAPRGDGKSSIVKYLALKYALTRQTRFPLIVAATSSKAKKILGSVQRRLASRSDSALSQDYPLECHVARYVDPWPSRARNVTANGQRPIHVEWGSDWFIVPTWEDTEPLGPIIYSLGITSDDLQGCNVYDQRPDFVMLDDLDSRDSLASEGGVVAEKIEEAIDKTVAGLGGQSRRLGQFMLCTITSRKSAAYKYSDPTIKPAFSGERVPAILKWPEAAHLWESYIELRQAGQRELDSEGRPKDVFGREAHSHYLINREAMDAGAVLSNPYNFEADLLADGTQKQVSALQRCYDYIADTGMDSFLTEHQNDPPAETGPIESGITAYRVQRQVSGYDRKIIPPGCTVLTMGVDCRKIALHWVVRAWRPDGTGYVIDYGVHEVTGTTYGSDDGLDVALKRAILSRMEDAKAADYHTLDGEIKPIDLTLIDAGWRTSAVYSACSEIGLGIYPVMGFGKSGGCTQANFHDVQHTTKDKRPGDGWFLSKKGNIWLVAADTDRWKAWEHDRWMTATSKPGTLMMFGVGADGDRLSADEKAHHAYARHICNEVEIEEPYKGTVRRRWKEKNENTHWLDASYYSNVAANMKGIRLLTQAEKKKALPSERPSARDLASKARKPA
jgi:hypothetical protein